MLKTNIDKLPIMLVEATPRHSTTDSKSIRDSEAQSKWVIGHGGITLNKKIGDNCIDILADRLEPGVSIQNSNGGCNNACMMYSCIGNRATIGSGKAKGSKGFVTGKQGDNDHLIIYFPDEVLRNISYSDVIRIEAIGLGMQLTDYDPEIVVRSVGPELLQKLPIVEKDGCLHVGVAKIVPGCLMGTGAGNSCSVGVDWDITLYDDKLCREHGLDKLRFGDIVAVMDVDCRNGFNHYTGAVSIGVIAHGNSVIPGHGPGVTFIMACKTDRIKPYIDENANLAVLFKEEM